MKTNGTMMLALLGAAMCSFFFGLGQHEAPAAVGGITGKGVTNCTNSCCEYQYCWWNGTNPLSAQIPGCVNPTLPGQNSGTALPSIWVQTQTPGGCKLVPQLTYDQWQWETSTATCQNLDGSYPVPQPVTPSGTFKQINRGLTRNECGT